MAKFSNDVAEHVLDNGLKVLTNEVHTAPVVACYIWFKVGGRNERPGITGTSHWVEHMLFKGTPNLPKDEFKRVVERNGGRWNGFTSTDYTAYFEVMPSDKIDEALMLEYERWQNSSFDPDEVASERSVIISEREGGENNPQFLLREEVLAAAYKAHPYQWGVIGWKSDLQSITRDDLYNHYKTYYVPNNATLVLVGDFDTDEIMKKVNDRFGEISSDSYVPQPTTVEPPQYGERRVSVRRAGNVPYIHIAYHIPAVGDDELYPLKVLQMILNYGKSSRLYRALIDTELSTHVYFSARELKDPGTAEMQADVRGDVEISAVEDALLTEIRKVQDEPVTEKEMGKAINQAEATFIYSQNSVSNRASRLGLYESIRSYKYLDTYLDRIKSVSKEDIQQVAQKYLTEDNRTVGHFQPTTSPRKQPRSGSRAETSAHSGNQNYHQPNLYWHHKCRGEDVSRDVTLYTEKMNGGGMSQRSSLKPIREVLDNGIVVIVCENHTNPTIAVRGWIKAGGMYDTEELAGCADFVANTISKGTENRTLMEMSEELDGIGANFSSGGHVERADVNARTLSKHFETVLEILSDVVLHPNFPEKEIEKHRGQVYNKLKAWNDNPKKVAWREIRKLIYPKGHPYHRRSQGNEETVAMIDPDSLFDFYNRYYRPDATTLTIVGDVNAEEIIEKVQNAFLGWEAEGEPENYEIPEIRLTEPARKNIPMADKSQCELCIGHVGISRTDKDFYAVNTMNKILGGSAGIGRLFATVRDVHGLAYHVGSSFRASIGAGPFIATAGVNPQNVEKAIECILSEIRKIRDRGITDDELADIKNMIVGNFLLSMETNNGIANVLLNSELYGLGLDYFRRHESIYRSITKKQVQEAAVKYLHPDKCSSTVAGPSFE